MAFFDISNAIVLFSPSPLLSRTSYRIWCPFI